MMKTLSRVLLVASLLFAVVVSQDNVGDSSQARPDDGEGNQIPDDSCVFWGDPHIWTFDSLMYSYQDPGWHHILISPRINIQSKFIPGCYQYIPTNACAQDMRIFVMDESNKVNVLELYLSPTARTGFTQVFNGSPFYQILINGVDAKLHSVWDGQQVTTPFVKPGQGIQIGSATNAYAYYFLAQRNTIFQLQFVLNTDIVISHIPTVLSITPTNQRVSQNSLWNQICGLCGTFNGYNGDDFQIHAGGNYNVSLAINNNNVQKFGNTWAVDYLASGFDSQYASSASEAEIQTMGVFTCNFQPNPTPPPTQPPTGTPAPPPTRAPPGPTPTPSTTPAPPPSSSSSGGGPTPAPTPSPTARPTPAPTPSATPAPTYPPTQPPTNPPTNTPTPSATPSAPTPTPTAPSKNTTFNYNSTDNSTAVNNAQGSPIYQQALTSCANAGLKQGDPLWQSCMYDVTQTNTTSTAVASAGALVLAGCARQNSNLNDTSCTADTLFACPGACNANGACVNGACQCNKGYQGDTCTASPLLTPAELAAVISAGAIAGIAIGGAVFAGLAGFGAKKGYDYYHMKDNKMANVNSNPLYAEKNTGGVSPLYAEKA